ncbi:M15 family metallopeptidase [Aquabacterium sp. CECT 9606]|uniref:M15 family metallopeptidase n=1 Tax=Aquabacterium sp. CECT 9606 TaxID=2845822 RepID=UPI001E4397CB|nr:M15 family metallopeptidase [Aquabacterium sp. CECT 9606]
MLAGWIFGYFVLGCLGLACLVFPSGRRAALSWLSASWKRRHQCPARVMPWVLLGSALLVLPAAGVWWWGGGLHGGRTLDAFDDTTADDGNHHVAHLLQGEQLVPPPPLPPEAFTTAEVEVVRPMLSSADRRWDRMDEAFVQRVLMAFKIMKERHGYDMALLEGYRSPERQNLLAAQGAHVTNAGAWQSYHQHGLAADCAFLREGKLVISEKDPWAMRGYQLYGQVAEELGLTWGGRWRMMDFGHVEWRRNRK